MGPISTRVGYRYVRMAYRAQRNSSHRPADRFEAEFSGAFIEARVVF